MEKKAVILVGVSGSGKSTFASREYPSAVTVSADHYFMVDGEYRFDVSKLGEAHGACLRAFVEAAISGVGRIVVDNTNTTLVELAPYISLAKAYGYGVEVVRVRCPVSVAAARNTHGVPEGAIRAMDARITAMMDAGLPPFWGVVVREVGA
jgi:predicted kinase